MCFRALTRHAYRYPVRRPYHGKVKGPRTSYRRQHAFEHRLLQRHLTDRPSLLKPTFFASLPIMGSSSGSTEQQRKLEDPDSQQLDANPDLVADSVYVKARNTMEVRAR